MGLDWRARQDKGMGLVMLKYKAGALSAMLNGPDGMKEDA